MHAVRLRLYHHGDGARVAYRELGAGPPLVLLHSALLSHKEWEPAVEQLADRFRVVLPDLPLHGDSEHGRGHPYTIDWFAQVLGGFAAEVLGPEAVDRGPGWGRGDRAGGRARRVVATGAAGADAQPPARGRRASVAAAGLARGRAHGGRAGAGQAALLRRARRVRAPAGDRPVVPRQPRGRGPHAPRLRRRGRQCGARPRVGEACARVAVPAPHATAGTVPAAAHAGAAAVGRR